MGTRIELEGIVLSAFSVQENLRTKIILRGGEL